MDRDERVGEARELRINSCPVGKSVGHWPSASADFMFAAATGIDDTMARPTSPQEPLMATVMAHIVL